MWAHYVVHVHKTFVDWEYKQTGWPHYAETQFKLRLYDVCVCVYTVYTSRIVSPLNFDKASYFIYL